VVEEATEGEMHGRIIRELRGTRGFGYDVLFVADGREITSAEMESDDKDEISHRGKALRAMAPIVADILVGL
jgi:XTP/dITP diphosphohydrolase